MKRSLSILLSLILMASNLSLTIGTHFCGGKAVESKMIVGEAHLGCGNMSEMGNSCNYSDDKSTDKVHFDIIPCCKDELQTFQVTDEFVKTAIQNSLNVEFAVEFIFTEMDKVFFPKSNHKFYTDYQSPPLEKEVLILFQSFLL